MIRGLILWILIASFGLSAEQLNNAEESEIRVIALFKNAAMVDFGGKQKIYRSGQNISAEIKLIKADPHLATFLVSGKQLELGLNSSSTYKITANESSQKQTSSDYDGNTTGQKSVKILRNNNGMYTTLGFINGISVHFLVDTGASQVAMNERVANLIGLPYKMEGDKISVATAAGIAPAWVTNLRKVRVGDIELQNVQALVVKGAGPNEVLLGMSFLNKLKMENNGQLLTLTKKY